MYSQLNIKIEYNLGQKIIFPNFIISQTIDFTNIG